MSTYLFIVLPLMLGFSAAVVLAGVVLFRLLGLSAIARGDDPLMADRSLEPISYKVLGEEKEIPVANEDEPKAPAADTTGAAGQESPEPETAEVDADSLRRDLEKGLSKLPIAFFVAADVTLALRQRVLYRGKWLKYADLPYAVVGPRRIHLIFDPTRISPKRGNEEEIDRAAFLTAKFLRSSLEAEFDIRCWLAEPASEGEEENAQYRSVPARAIGEGIRRLEEQQLPAGIEAASKHASRLIELLRACQPADMRPLQKAI